MRSTSLFFPAAAYLVGLALAPAPSEAAPFDPAIVASDAAWVVHVDVEAALASKLGGALVGHALSQEDNRQHLDMLKMQFGIDALSDLHSVTLYGSNAEDPEEAVVLIAGSANIAAALDKAAAESKGEIVKTPRGYSLHDGEASAIVFEGRGGRTLLVLSQDDDMVDQGARVVSGEAQNLGDANWGSLRPVNTAGAIAIVSVSSAFAQAFDDDAPPLQMLLNGSDGVSVVVAERGANAVVEVALTSQNEQQAQGLAGMVQGFVGMAHGMMQMKGGAHGKHNFEEFKQFADILNGINVSAEGRDLSLSITYDVDRLLQLIEHADF